MNIKIPFTSYIIRLYKGTDNWNDIDGRLVKGYQFIIKIHKFPKNSIRG